MATTALSGAHTAGIYADLTLDGPEIGTLVVIFDRAKNLPNRKTMGKQDPYCAARLGKEAKKTETDKRGGQTPKWSDINIHNSCAMLTFVRDQEMRFTVHDSPDYNQLKVSVFNDDKKTELIGETWVALDQIIVPGGGTNDFWHSLNCKGRYAGDIRIELTYYDTRPRTEIAEDRRQSTPTSGSMDKVTSGIGGPRQPKPVKRRPLPADPTDTSRSSSLPQTPSSAGQNISAFQQRYVESPDDYSQRNSSPTDKRFQRLYEEQHRDTSLNKPQQSHTPYTDNMSVTPAPIQSNLDMYDHTGQAEYRQASVPTFSQSPQSGHVFDQGDEYDNTYMGDWHPRPPVQPLQNGMIHSNSSPAMIDPRLRPKTVPQAWQYPENAVEDEDPPPPPPPVHRSTAPSTPQNMRARSIVTGSPLATVQSHSPFHGHQSASTSPSHSQNHLNHGIPSSLVPGYDSESRSSTAQSRQQPVVQSLENMHGRRAHRYSAPVDQYHPPIPKPRAVSPGRRSPVRKSLSPSPAPAEGGIPFSPDSFEAYNPSIGANSVNDPGARYSTPEQAQEAFRQHKRQEKLGDGPIIGNDGRIIDPSDHLPTETWAPEPEQKTPTRRGPEVAVRFRNSPQGAQPMPGRRPLNEARTQSATTPPFAHNAGNGAYYSPNRLQHYPRNSPGNVPPPVPGKIPMGGGKEDWGDPLSEEIRRIDIGSGRRRGYGP